MSSKVSLAIGFSTALMVMIVLVPLGIGIVIAFGFLVWLSPATAAVLMIFLVLIANFFFGDPKRTGIIAFLLFLALAILFGKEIQSWFEMISPIFGCIEVIP
ncbi:MAG: hypothetical protein AYK18_07030 [Theionarchaea archaeon DG-70]|nr:MAG: hypothetical protein AYK18_07030 [Theionarchaea archaeon DG-70]